MDRSNLRFLIVTSQMLPRPGEGYSIQFFEDGTYIRSWDLGDLDRWRLNSEDMLEWYNNEPGLVHREGWLPFFGTAAPEPVTAISAILKRWVDEMEFHDSVDSVLDRESDPIESHRR